MRDGSNFSISLLLRVRISDKDSVFQRRVCAPVSNHLAGCISEYYLDDIYLISHSQGEWTTHRDLFDWTEKKEEKRNYSLSRFLYSWRLYPFFPQIMRIVAFWELLQYIPCGLSITLLLFDLYSKHIFKVSHSTTIIEVSCMDIYSTRVDTNWSVCGFLINIISVLI